MLEEFKKSIQSVLYERISSPFSGAFVLSWFVWNWKFIYYLITVDSKLQFSERIQFIESNYIHWQQTLIYPILSAAFFVILYPFVTTGAMYVWLRHKEWQSEIKNEIEKKQLLTFEQSVELRFQIRNQAERFEKMLQEKDLELKSLEEQMRNHSSFTTNEPITLEKNSEETPSADIVEFTKLLDSVEMQKDFPILLDRITKGYLVRDAVSPYTISKFEAYSIIEKTSKDAGIYTFTAKGKEFLKWYFSTTKN